MKCSTHGSTNTPETVARRYAFERLLLTNGHAHPRLPFALHQHMLTTHAQTGDASNAAMVGYCEVQQKE